LNKFVVPLLGHGKRLCPYGPQLASKNLAHIPPQHDVSTERQLFTDTLLETIDVGIVSCDATGGNLRRNRAERLLLDLPDQYAQLAPDQAAATIDVLDAAGERVDPENYPLARALRGETVDSTDFRIGPRGGPYRDVLIRGSQIATPDGRTLGAVVAISDVSAERTASRELSLARHQALEVNALFTAVLSASPDLTFVTDVATGAVVFASPDKVILGVTSAQLEQLGADVIGSLVHPEEQPRLQAANAAARDLADGAVLNLLYRARHIDGSWHWLDRRVTSFRRSDVTGKVVEVLGVVRDVTEEHTTQLALRDSEATFRAIVSQVVDYAIIGLDPAGIIRSWNAGAQRLKGYTAGQAIGRHFSMFYTDAAQQDGLPGRLLDIARAQGRVDDTGWRVREDGSKFYANIVITALRDEAGALSGYVKVTQDLTAQHQLAEAQASLFAAVTHDLRNPIFAIEVFAELLVGVDPDPADVRTQYLEGIQVQATQLRNLVDGLFDYAKLRGEPASMTLEPLVVSELARTCAAAFRAVSPSHQIEVQDSVDEVLADRTAMTRVLTNLISNAIKYSPAGTPVSITIDGTAADVVRVAVSDRGRGIAAGDIDTIFGEFNRGRLAQDDEGGTGLGLASVAHLTAAQGGRVWIDSDVGHGTTATVQLTRAPAGT
jgi:PAS domain S-box-containing protein